MSRHSISRLFVSRWFRNRGTLLLAVALSAGATLFTCKSALAHDRPFKASLSGNANLTPTENPCIVQNDETAAGHASHMGNITWESVEFVDFCAIPGGVAVTGTFVMTAANGDQLLGTYETIGFPDVNGDLIIHGTFTIAGGTGRFSDATGSGDIDAVASLAPGLPFEGGLSGRIDY